MRRSWWSLRQCNAAIFSHVPRQTLLQLWTQLCLQSRCWKCCFNSCVPHYILSLCLLHRKNLSLWGLWMKTWLSHRLAWNLLEIFTHACLERASASDSITEKRNLFQTRNSDLISFFQSQQISLDVIKKCAQQNLVVAFLPLQKSTSLFALLLFALFWQTLMKNVCCILTLVVKPMHKNNNQSV